jgi:type IV secretory pathway VirB10-like protein
MITNRATFAALALIGVVAGGSAACNRERQQPPSQTRATQDVNLPSSSGVVTETENSLATPPAQSQTPVAPVVAAPPVAAEPARPAKPVAARPVARRPAAETTQRSSRPSPSYSRQAPADTSASTPNNPPVSAAIEPVESTTVERRQAIAEPPQKQYEELVIPADSVVGLQIDSAVTSDRAKVEDAVKARVTRDVKVRDRVAIPAGARAEGSVTLVDRGGRLKDQARLGIRFHTIVLADGTRLPINTETIYRDGDSPARESAAKIGGGAVGGAVLGAILGGKKGAIIGSTVGAGAGGAVVAAGEPSTATLPAGSTVTVRMSAPATVTVEK